MLDTAAPLTTPWLPPGGLRPELLEGGLVCRFGRRRDPARDLGPRVEPELVPDAADMGVDRALGDEQTRSDLLVAQAVRNQPSDVGLPLPQRPRTRAIRRRDGIGALAERQPDRGAPARAPPGPELGIEPRWPERRNRRLFGSGQ